MASGFLVERPGVSTVGQQADQGWRQPWVIAAEDPVRIENVSLWSGTTVYERLSMPELAAPPSRVCAPGSHTVGRRPQKTPPCCQGVSAGFAAHWRPLTHLKSPAWLTVMMTLSPTLDWVGLRTPGRPSVLNRELCASLSGGWLGGLLASVTSAGTAGPARRLNPGSGVCCQEAKGRSAGCLRRRVW